jgi:hypothetical protein
LSYTVFRQAEVLEHHRHAGDWSVMRGHRPALAGIDRDQPVDAAQQRGLAAAARADDGDDLAVADASET